MTNKQRLEEIEKMLAVLFLTPSSQDHKWLIERVKKLTEALESISKNSCCDQCQQAKYVALKALEESE